MNDHLYLLLDTSYTTPRPVRVYADWFEADSDGRALNPECWYRVVRLPYRPRREELDRQRLTPAHRAPDLCACGHPYQGHRVNTDRVQAKCNRCRCVLSAAQ